MGEGKDYIPWIKVQDFSSKGRSHRIAGWKTKRVHHLFSDQEKRMFFLLEWSDIVMDIREQYPLSDLNLTLDIATRMNVKYPINSKNQTPYILTTDFMITCVINGELCHKARTIRSTKELENKRTLEKLEIERRYYQHLGIDWAVVTEKGIPKILADNVELIHESYDFIDFISDKNSSELKQLCEIIKHNLHNKKHQTVAELTNELDEQMSLEVGTSFSIFKHLVAQKEITLDMFNHKISGSLSTNLIKVRTN
jgi:hypothetical protein